MTGHAAPFHCPYCGEETIRPFGGLDDPHGQWRCDSCRRAFRLRLLGLTRPGAPGEPGDPGDGGRTGETGETGDVVSP